MRRRKTVCVRGGAGEGVRGAQTERAAHYLSGAYLSEFTDSDLAIVNAWLDPEARRPIRVSES